MSVLIEIEEAVAAVRERVGPAVVGLGRGWGRGSGVVVAPGRILAAATAPRGEEVTVARADGRRVPARVAGVDSTMGLAVLEADTGDAAPVAWEAGADPMVPGRSVFALARPGGRALRASWGLVTSTEAGFGRPRGRRVRGAIEHTAALPPGSAGGPLVDAEGALVGLNAIRLDGGLILAVPADRALAERVAALAAGLEARGRTLGVAVAPPGVARRMRRAVGLPDRDGVLVRDVEADGPAAGALRRGDLIVRAAGRDVGGVDDLRAVLDEAATPARLELLLVRGADEVGATVEIGPPPGPEAAR